jgi:hypothetical protein
VSTSDVKHPIPSEVRPNRHRMDGSNRSWLAGFMKARDLLRRGQSRTVESVVDEVATEMQSQCFDPDMQRLTSGVIAGLKASDVPRGSR